MTPVVLIGIDRDTLNLKVIGLYETEEDARHAVKFGDLPPALYSLATPPMNGVLISVVPAANATDV